MEEQRVLSSLRETVPEITSYAERQKYQSAADELEKTMRAAGIAVGTREWFKWTRTPEGRLENELLLRIYEWDDFAAGQNAQDQADALS